MIATRRLTALLLSAAAIFVLLGCTLTRVGMRIVEIGELQRESLSIERGDADRARVQVRIGAGDLVIDGGAEALMEAEFAYNVRAWQPVVTYTVNDGQGLLTVRQPAMDRVSLGGNIQYAWQLRFDDTTPLDMRIESGAGRQNIDLTGLTITRLDVKLGAGDANLNVSDNPGLERIGLDIGVGSVDIDLRGPRDQDVAVTVQGGVGSTSLHLPNDIGVRVEVTRGLGDVDTSGLIRQGGAWVNEAYGTSDVTMDLRIRTGVGSITLDVAD